MHVHKLNYMLNFRKYIDRFIVPAARSSNIQHYYSHSPCSIFCSARNCHLLVHTPGKIRLIWKAEMDTPPELS
jgi:hypothetical protein